MYRDERTQKYFTKNAVRILIVSKQLLKERPDYGSIGTNSPRVDSSDKLRGEAKYISDYDDEELLYGAVVRSNRPSATIERVDTTKAEAISEVVCALSRTDLLGDFDSSIRHYGDVIGAVAATDRETALEAARAVDFELDQRESVFDPRDAVSSDAPEIHADEPIGLNHTSHEFTVENDDFEKNVDDYHYYETGDVTKAFARSEVVLEETYRTPRVNHCNLETHCCIAEWDGDTLFLTDSTPSGHLDDKLAEFLGVSPANVHVRWPEANSSSFGGQVLPKLTLEPVAATLARRTGHPVKLWFDREEDFVATDTRHPVYYEIRMGISESGELLGLDMQIFADTGAYPNGIGHVVLANNQNRVLDIYDVPNYRFEGMSVYTNNVVAGEYRGIGSTQLGYALEAHVDEICRVADVDPVEFRRKNFVSEGDIPPNRETPISSCGVVDCLERGFDEFEKTKRGPAVEPRKLYGWGFASATHTTGSVREGYDVETVRITLSKAGTAEVSALAIDSGQGSDTVLTQIVSEETGLPAEQITIATVDSDDDIESGIGTVASRGTWIIGGATKETANELLTELETRTESSIERIEDDTAVLANGQRLPLDRLFRPDEEEIEVQGQMRSNLRPPSYGVHFAEVEVDRDTGRVDVLTYVAAQDVGHAINPALVEGQIEGAVLHGLESVLYSELRLDRGNPRNANLSDYPVISPWEMPATVVCELIEAEEASGPYGAKGVGTPAMAPIAPAVANALRDATGTRFTDLPIDMETVLRAIEDF